MYNITFPDNSSSNCFDSVIYSLLKYYDFEYEAYNIEYFYTDYYREPFNKNNTAHGIFRGKTHANILKDIYDADLIFGDGNETDRIFETICNILIDRPVGITIDPYYCHWSPFYQKSHYGHMILIVDIDYCNKKYICFDVHFKSFGYIEVDFDVIHKNYEQYFIFDFNEVNGIKLESMINKIGFLLDNFDDNLAIKKTEMINYFAMSDKKALFPDNLETSVPLINLMWIAEDKKHFSIALRYIENKIKKVVFSSIYELLLTSEKNFVLLKSILIKYAMTGVLRENNLITIINRIFDTDALIVEQMNSIIKEIKKQWTI